MVRRVAPDSGMCPQALGQLHHRSKLRLTWLQNRPRYVELWSNSPDLAENRQKTHAGTAASASAEGLVTTSAATPGERDQAF